MNFIITENGITFRANGRTYNVASDHESFDELHDRLIDDNVTADEAVELATHSARRVSAFDPEGRLQIENGVLKYKGNYLRSSLSDRIIEMDKRGISYEHLIHFLDNVMENPSTESKMELFDFLEKNSLPITPDGHILAYKRVRENFRDVHTGTYDNSPGNVIEMPRYHVDADRNVTCSTGLHFASWDYVHGFGATNDPVVILKINPRDVVSIPVDYNNQKGRCCQYEVIAVLPSSSDRLKDYAIRDERAIFEGELEEEEMERIPEANPDRVDQLNGMDNPFDEEAPSIPVQDFFAMDDDVVDELDDDPGMESPFGYDPDEEEDDEVNGTIIDSFEFDSSGDWLLYKPVDDGYVIDYVSRTEDSNVEIFGDDIIDLFWKEVKRFHPDRILLDDDRHLLLDLSNHFTKDLNGVFVLHTLKRLFGDELGRESFNAIKNTTMYKVGKNLPVVDVGRIVSNIADGIVLRGVWSEPKFRMVQERFVTRII